MTQDFHRLSWPRFTRRLAIRPAVAEDAAATWSIRGRPEVAFWMTSRVADEAAHVEHFRVPERLAKTLVVELEGQVIADLMLAIEDAWAQSEAMDQALGVHAEIGWSLDPEYGGRGYATEAVNELLRVCFEELGLRRVTAECFAGNERSWQLMERVGMRRESYAVSDALHRELGWLDSMTYAMLATDWRQLRASDSSTELSDSSADTGDSSTEMSDSSAG
jgi:RimJ/RimL family protein N-acetyltransferase